MTTVTMATALKDRLSDASSKCSETKLKGRVSNPEFLQRWSKFSIENQHLCLSITRISVTYPAVPEQIALNPEEKPLPLLPSPPLHHPAIWRFNLPAEKVRN